MVPTCIFTTEVPNNDLLASGGSVAGSDTQVQYNNGGSFGGASALIYDDVNNRVGIGTATSPLLSSCSRSNNR